MRGNRRYQAGERLGMGSIPAYAGEPRSARRGRRRFRVYPRVCGGTPVIAICAGQPAGLSPRMRGNRTSGNAPPISTGSIPAYAGEPVCRLPARTYAEGLSPRMRGNLQFPQEIRLRPGSIPAYAGEPFGGSLFGLALGVYPRVCGGTPPPPVPTSNPQGLSPRMRGNRYRLRGWSAHRGSIPAYAGEPTGD